MMRVTTTSGATYTYNPSDNSIIEGKMVVGQPFVVKFAPLAEINDLPDVDSFTIGVTEQCNMRCSYCCYSGGYPEHRSHSSRSLGIKDIPMILAFVRETSRRSEISFDFYGGESLLRSKWIAEFVTAAKTALTDKTLRFEISTNGLLLSREVVDFLVEEGFRVFVSIDGVGDSHDGCRKDIAGNGTFARISANLQYIKDEYPQFWESNLDIMMTLPDITRLPAISDAWSRSDLLADKMPIRMSEVSTVYNPTTPRLDYDEQEQKYLALVSNLIAHPESRLLKTFFDIFLAEWIQRPIFELTEPVVYPTCVPRNRKLFVDSGGSVGICENVSDNLRIGNIREGLDFSAINDIARKTADLVDERCSRCTHARICDVCPDMLSLPPEARDIYCHNQKVLHRIKLLCFCQLAEADMI